MNEVWRAGMVVSQWWQLPLSSGLTFIHPAGLFPHTVRYSEVTVSKQNLPKAVWC